LIYCTCDLGVRIEVEMSPRITRASYGTLNAKSLFPVLTGVGKTNEKTYCLNSWCCMTSGNTCFSKILPIDDRPAFLCMVLAK
jgi:hypothetical protein